MAAYKPQIVLRSINKKAADLGQLFSIWNHKFVNSSSSCRSWISSSTCLIILQLAVSSMLDNVILIQRIIFVYLLHN